MMDTVLLQVNIITNMRYTLCVQFKESVSLLLWYLLLKVSSVCERERELGSVSSINVVVVTCTMFYGVAAA